MRPYIEIIRLYIFIFLHQTTTASMGERARSRLYIFIFLHQTTTFLILDTLALGCISLYSYIKPQQSEGVRKLYLVVYLYIPTSNHNVIISMLK